MRASRVVALVLLVALPASIHAEDDPLEALFTGKPGPAAPSVEDEVLGPRPWKLEEVKPLLEEIAAVDTARAARVFVRAAEKELSSGHSASALALLERAGETGRALRERLLAPSLSIEGERVRVNNASAVARPFALEPALDDLVSAFRTSDDPPDLARFAAAHTTGEPLPIEKALPETGDALLVETRPEGARAVLARGIAIHVERHERGLAVAAWDARTGAAVAGHVLVVLGASEPRDGKLRRFSSLAAVPLDEEGFALAPLDERFQEALVVVRSEDGRAAWAAVPLHRSQQTVERDADERPRLTVHWERTLLRPGETARALVLARRWEHASLVPLAPGEKVEVLLVDASGKELARKELGLGNRSAAIFETQVPQGLHHVEAKILGLVAHVEGEPLLVGTPRAGALELAAHAPPWTEPGAPIDVRLEARDALGAPVVGRVRWRLIEEPSRIVSEGAVATDGSGNAALSLTARADARLDAFLTDAVGREAATSARIAASTGPIRLAASCERRFANVNEEVLVDLDAETLEGKLEDMKGAAFVSKEGVLAQRLDFATKEGRARVSIKLPAPGAWDVAFVTTPTHAAIRIFVGETPSPTLEVVPERSRYPRGETARFLVRGPAGARVLVLARGEQGVHPGFPRALAPGVLAIELDRSFSPGFEVEALAVIDGKLERARARVVVTPLGSPLEVELSADKPEYKPEEKPVLKVHAQGRDGLPARSSEVFVSFEDADEAHAAERASGAEADLVLARRHDAHVAPTGFVGLGTNDNGDAQTQLTFPGAGRWLARAIAVSPEGKWATSELVLAARPRLSLDLGAPAAVTSGDVVRLVLAVRNEGDKEAGPEVSIASSAPGLLALEGPAKEKLAVPPHGFASLHVTARALKPGHVKLDAKLAFPREDQTVSDPVVVTGPLQSWLSASAATVGSDAVGTPASSVALVAPEGPRLLLRVETPDSALCDLVAELARPGARACFAFAPALLARRAFDARGTRWDVITKRAGVDPAEVLVASDPGKGPRDPRRNPLFAKPRLDALAKEGLEELATRASAMGWSWRPGGAPDPDETAFVLASLALARECGAAVAPELIDRGAAALDSCLTRPGPPAERARAALALVLAGKPAPLDKLESPDRETELLVAFARLRANPQEAEKTRARALLETLPVDATSAALELELATLLDPKSDLARALADEVVARRPVPALAEPRLALLLAHALAEHARLTPPRQLVGNVKVKGLGTLELKPDDPQLVEAALLRDTPAPVGTLFLSRSDKGEVRVTALALADEPRGGEPVVARSYARLVRERVAERGFDHLRARFEPATTVRRGDVVRVQLVIRLERGLDHLTIEEPLPAGFELLRASGLAVEPAGTSVRLHADTLAPGEHRAELLLRATLAGEIVAPATRAWREPAPGQAGRNEAVSLRILD
jgi:hypothetical protein